MKRALLLAACTCAVLLYGIAPSSAETVSQTITGGTLSVSASDVSFSAATLTGSNQTVTQNAASIWTLIDARGTGASWAVSMSATTPTSAAGSVETTARTIGVGNLAASTGTITAGVGSSPTTNITGSTSLALSNSAQTLLSSTGNTLGTYTFTPSFAFTIPANAYRSNYSGTVGSSALNPYTSTLTITVA